MGVELQIRNKPHHVEMLVSYHPCYKVVATPVSDWPLVDDLTSVVKLLPITLDGASLHSKVWIGKDNNPDSV